MSGHLIDTCGRAITYLRLSVTDRCNLRCTYCQPAGCPITCASQDEVLSAQQWVKLVRVAASMGIRKVRLTGGEPLVRSDIVSLVRGLASVQGITELALTTNGLLLDGMAQDLRGAGLTRVNVSLDSLHRETYRRITGSDGLDQVMKGIHQAEQAGLHPIKINVVVMKGINDHELVDFARLTKDHPWQVRFIEYMPIGNQESDWESYFFPVSEMHRALEPLGVLVPHQAQGSDPARVYQLHGGGGTIGFISPVTEHFCSACNRLRVTSDGKLRLCLLGDTEVDLRPYLMDEVSDEELGAALQAALLLKPAGHRLKQQLPHLRRRMSQIGG
ncbi:MAG: GTP 3',8-cyclase MoaA [Bacillota bacterium]